MTTNARWKNRPPGSNWGDFGPDDQCGRANLITREKVLQGVAEVKEGLTFNLSLPLDYPGGAKLQPRRHPPRLQAASRDGTDYYVRPYHHEYAGGRLQSILVRGKSGQLDTIGAAIRSSLDNAA